VDLCKTLRQTGILSWTWINMYLTFIVILTLNVGVSSCLRYFVVFGSNYWTNKRTDIIPSDCPWIKPSKQQRVSGPVFQAATRFPGRAVQASHRVTCWSSIRLTWLPLLVPTLRYVVCCVSAVGPSPISACLKRHLRDHNR